MRNTRKLFVIGVLTLANSASSQTLQRVWPVPRSGTFWSMQLTNPPPMPSLPDYLPSDTPVYQITNRVYVYDDRNVDYSAVNELIQTVNSASASYPPAPGSGLYGGGGGGTNVYSSPKFGSNDFYLSILLDTNVPGYVDLELHNAPATTYFQLLTNTVLTTPMRWFPGQIVSGDPTTNNVWFNALPCDVPSNQFFRAVTGVAVVRVYTYPYFRVIAEPPGTPNTGWFVIDLQTPNPTGLRVVYNLTGSAVNGVDYTNTPTSVFIPANVLSTNIYIQSTNDNKIDFDEQVVLSLVLTNGYLIDPASWQATITISDNLTNMIQAVLTDLPVSDLDYHSASNSLIASAYYPDWNTGTNYFARISTYFTTNGGTVVTNVAINNWSHAGGSVAETRITVVKTNTNTGFHSGETFFVPPDTNGTIGWISTNGLSWTNTWLTITVESNAFSGDIYVDQTGIWGGDVFAVSGRGGGIPSENMNIWRVNTNKQVSLVASIPTDHLEGLITLPNDPTKYGPWSGKLITANENVGLFFAVDTNGNYQSFNLDVNGEPIGPSAIKVIPANWHLYFSDPRSNSTLPPLVLKIPQQYFTNYIGDLLVTRAGETSGDAALFIVHWDNARNTFVTVKIPYGNQGAPFYGQYIEHATFAPVDLPPIQLQ